MKARYRGLSGPRLTVAQRRIGALLQAGLLARGVDRPAVRDAALAYQEYVLANPIPRPTLAGSGLAFWRYLRRYGREWERERVRAVLAEAGLTRPDRSALAAALDPDARGEGREA